MYDTRTVCQSHISVTNYIKSLFLLFFANLIGIRKQRFIFLILQILSGTTLQHRIPALQHRVAQGFRQIIGVSVILNLHIGFVRIDTKSHIAGQGPGRSGPCQNIGILPLHLKPGNGRAFLHILISLCHLMAGQRRTAPGTIGHNLKALVQKPLLPYLL